MTLKKPISVKVCISVFAGLVFLLVTCVALQLFFQNESSRWDKTQRELNVFAGQVGKWSFVHDTIPGLSLTDVLYALEQDTTDEYRQSQYPMVLEGHDAWGNPLRYQVDLSGKKAIIQSAGSNGIFGDDDDIIQEIFFNLSEEP